MGWENGCGAIITKLATNTLNSFFKSDTLTHFLATISIPLLISTIFLFIPSYTHCYGIIMISIFN